MVKAVETPTASACTTCIGGIAVQFFLAGLGVFGITSFLPHIIFGTLVVVASFALPIIALVTISLV